MPDKILESIVYLISLGIITATEAEAFQQLADGISAKAQNEGRDTTPDEDAVIEAARQAARDRLSGPK